MSMKYEGEGYWGQTPLCSWSSLAKGNTVALKKQFRENQLAPTSIHEDQVRKSIDGDEQWDRRDQEAVTSHVKNVPGPKDVE